MLSNFQPRLASLAFRYGSLEDLRAAVATKRNGAPQDPRIVADATAFCAALPEDAWPLWRGGGAEGVRRGRRDALDWGAAAATLSTGAAGAAATSRPGAAAPPRRGAVSSSGPRPEQNRVP